ncbi:hypothetical protein ANABIO32_11670 [Rossellomorea marisflavi]|uniref:hypothetical protein n=1 Tax=Rossellomorea marisflavi TaxID=189381 RepID=UPI0025C7F5EA|nr:hypothetical protein [Rossellomorea marisflavi]GLI83474.1 hypothetical protein ANABIO32_11670 [Rossellomorea marisflavi]
MEKIQKFLLPDGIKESIFKYRFKDFLKSIDKPFSGNVYDRLEQALVTDQFLGLFEKFVIDEISNGKNRQVYWCDFSIETLAILGEIDKIRGKLKENKYKSEDFNDLLSLEDFDNGDLVYLEIKENDSGEAPDKISLAFMEKYDIISEGDEGPLLQRIYDYVWIDIYPAQQYLQIKSRPYSNQYFANLHESNRVFQFYHNLMKKIFNISYLNMEESKGVLYNIFKVLTDRAEASYCKEVEEIKDQVYDKTKELASLLNISDISHPVDMPNRISRLLERVLILEDIDNYMSYDPDKLGIVDRIDFSDQSGAKVNALSQEEGIEIADIYFDTRETLDELKQLNKLWIRWFMRTTNGSEDETTSKIEQIETRIEVYADRILIIFLGVQSVPKEVQYYVLSKIKKFKEGENSGLLD